MVKVLTIGLIRVKNRRMKRRTVKVLAKSLIRMRKNQLKLEMNRIMKRRIVKVLAKSLIRMRKNQLKMKMSLIRAKNRLTMKKRGKKISGTVKCTLMMLEAPPVSTVWSINLL